MVILTSMMSIVTKQSRIVFRDESSYVSVVSPNLRSELYSHPVYPVVTYKPRLFFYVVAEIFSFLDHLLFRLNCLGLFVWAFYSALYLALFAFQYLSPHICCEFRVHKFMQFASGSDNLLAISTFALHLYTNMCL